MTGNNLEYRDLKNFNWIKEKLNNDAKSIHKLERPWTRSGEKRGLDFSFIEKDTHHDLIAEGSYFEGSWGNTNLNERPVNRNKQRRPVSRQVRLNKRVNHLRGGRIDSDSYRGDMGDTEQPGYNESINVHMIQKVIPEHVNLKPVQESVSPIKIITNKEPFLDRKRSLRDSTSLDPNLKVNKSINFNRKNSNEPIKQDCNYKNASSNKHFIVSELNRSIESIQMKDKIDNSQGSNDGSSNLKNLEKIKGKVSVFKDANGVRIMKKKGNNHKNWYSPSIPKNNKNELYCIQEEKEPINDKNVAHIYDSFVSTTQDTKDNRVTDSNNIRQHKRNLNRHDDLLKAHKAEFEEILSRKMKRTDGFMAFKPSLVGGNSSNSLLPSNSGQENEIRVETNSDITHQTSSTTSDQARINKAKQFKVNQNKAKLLNQRDKHGSNDAKSKYKSRNNQVIGSKNTEPGVAVGSQNSSSSYLGFKTLYTTNFLDYHR